MRSLGDWGTPGPGDNSLPTTAVTAAAVPRLQRRAEAEEKRSTALAAELATERRNTADVTEFLTNELKARALAAAAREARLTAATRELATTRSSAEARPAHTQARAFLCSCAGVAKVCCSKQGSETPAAHPSRLCGFAPTFVSA